MDATELAYAGAARQAALVAAGEVSAAEVVQACLERIERHDRELNAFRVVLAEQALAEAARGGQAGPLAGVPVAVKDDVDVAGELTPRGSAAVERRATADAEVVRRLRAAGAIVVGKTHVPELTHAPWTESMTYGATRNPWDRSRTPGGSSGGSAAAAAAGMCGVALGSDGGGSIRGPASWCGLFGLKPTRDRVPLAPNEGAWQGLSTNGPLGRRTADAAAFLAATADDGAELAAAADADPPPLRIAVSTKLPAGVVARLGVDQRAAVERVAGRLRELGHEVVERDPDYPPGLSAAVTGRILRGIADDAARVERPELLEPRVRRLAAMGRAVPIDRARRCEAEHARRIAVLFEDCDLLLTPAHPRGPLRIGQAHGHGASRYLAVAGECVAWFAAFNHTGQPAAAVPAGRDADGLPLGVQLVARPRAEATLLAVGGQLERAHPWAEARPPL